MNPIREKKVIVTAPLAALKRRFRNRPTSSIGAAVPPLPGDEGDEQNAAATTKPTTLRVAPQPRFGASMIV